MKKEDLKKGDVILFPPHDGDFIAKAIAYLTNGEVNHAALCYPSEQGLLVAESILKNGLVLNPFPEHIDEKYPLRICRMKKPLDVEPLLKTTQKYLNEKNAYPNFNLGLLGGLLLFKKFAPHTLRNKVIYTFMELVANRLMILVRQRKYANKHPMSCSQFVAQCFTDTGADYDLHFDNLTVDFDEMPLLGIHKTNALQDSAIAPIEILEQENNLSSVGVNNAELDIDDLSDKDAMQLTDQFIDVLEGKERFECSNKAPSALLKNNNITLQKLALSLYELHTGKQAPNLNQAIEWLKSPTMRNYFVSPQDILKNCPDSLTFVGLLSY